MQHIFSHTEVFVQLFSKCEKAQGVGQSLFVHLCVMVTVRYCTCRCPSPEGWVAGFPDPKL